MLLAPAEEEILLAHLSFSWRNGKASWSQHLRKEATGQSGSDLDDSQLLVPEDCRGKEGEESTSQYTGSFFDTAHLKYLDHNLILPSVNVLFPKNLEIHLMEYHQEGDLV